MPTKSRTPEQRSIHAAQERARRASGAMAPARRRDVPGYAEAEAQRAAALRAQRIAAGVDPNAGSKRHRERQRRLLLEAIQEELHAGQIAAPAWESMTRERYLEIEPSLTRPMTGSSLPCLRSLVNLPLDNAHLASA